MCVKHKLHFYAKNGLLVGTESQPPCSVQGNVQCRSHQYLNFTHELSCTVGFIIQDPGMKHQESESLKKVAKVTQPQSRESRIRNWASGW